ncbi:MAG: dTDP-glucose 4,6-dehydratase [Lentisphaerae bacterium RIFOXYA12_FULL_48_11]|nr:MAG: dTDP-glucose 4,6-dehydratase [Lentisphaerae bacterium RIFOXYA12_FULL_48_11]
MKILVTGGAGFIASNFVRYMLSRYPDVSIVNLDSLTYAGNLENLADLDERRHVFIKGDISSVEDVESVFKKHSFENVVNFAAESHVDRSLHFGAQVFIRTNIAGTQVLLDMSRQYGVKRFVQISTDEVYGSLGNTGKFTEMSTIQPNNPYAATKASADFMVRAAHKSHGLNAVITRCSNNFGPYQFPEKLIPLMIANALENRDLPVYGDGMHVRDWIFVIDHCSAIDLVMRNAEAGSIYNIGSDHDVPNLEIVKLVLKILDKPETLIKHVLDRPGHDRRYAMDSSKIRKDLGWRPAFSFEQAMKKTVDWYLGNRAWLEHIRSGAYMKYYETLYRDRLAKSSS